MASLHEQQQENNVAATQKKYSTKQKYQQHHYHHHHQHRYNETNKCNQQQIHCKSFKNAVLSCCCHIQQTNHSTKLVSQQKPASKIFYFMLHVKCFLRQKKKYSFLSLQLQSSNSNKQMQLKERQSNSQSATKTIVILYKPLLQQMKNVSSLYSTQ